MMNNTNLNEKIKQYNLHAENVKKKMPLLDDLSNKGADSMMKVEELSITAINTLEYIFSCFEKMIKWIETDDKISKLMMSTLQEMKDAIFNQYKLTYENYLILRNEMWKNIKIFEKEKEYCIDEIIACADLNIDMVIPSIKVDNIDITFIMNKLSELEEKINEQRINQTQTKYLKGGVK